MKLSVVYRSTAPALLPAKLCRGIAIRSIEQQDMLVLHRVQYAESTYSIPPEQVVGSVGGTTYGCDANGEPIPTKEPKLLLNDDHAGRPEGIHMMIGRRPYAASGNSVGDKQMLEYTKAGDGARLAMLVLQDDAVREYAYGPAQGLPDTKFGTFPQDYYDPAIKNRWVVISMKNDWKRIFAFEK